MTGGTVSREGDDDVVLISAPHATEEHTAARAKRKAEEAADVSPASKKARQAGAVQASEVIELD